MHHLLRTLVIVLLVTGLLAMLTATASACPTCKDGLAENDAAGRTMAAGYFYSILFMMSMPFVIIGTFGGAAYLSIRRARRQQATSAQLASEQDSVAGE